MENIDLSISKRLDDLDYRLGSYRSQSWRASWVVTAVFLIVLAVLISISLFFIPATTIAHAQAFLQPNGGGISPPSLTVGGEADFIKVVIPLLAVAFGFAVGFLGLKRLEQFDNEINGLRSNLQNQLLEERRLAASDRDRLVKANEDRFSEFQRSQTEVLDRIEKRQSELKIEIEHAASHSLNEIKDERNAAKSDRQSHRQELLSELTKRTEEVKAFVKIAADDLAKEAIKPIADETLGEISTQKKDLENILETIHNRLHEFGWLKQHANELDSLVGITSAGVAHSKAVEFFHTNKIDAAMKLADRITRTKMGGSESDFHNLAAQYAQNDYHEQATSMVLLGLEFFPNNIDLIADGIKYATSCGKMSVAEELEKQLLAIPLRKWNWRAYVFLADYYGAKDDDEKRLHVYSQFQDQALSSSDERGYSEAVEYFIKSGDLSKAEQLAKEGIAKCSQSPQCAFHLAQMKFDQGICEDAIHFSSMALSQNLAAQPTVNMSSILWYRGAARAKMCLQLSNNNNVKDIESLEQLAIDAANDLRMSVALPRAIRQHSQQASVQIQLLRHVLLGLKSSRANEAIFRELEDSHDSKATMMAALAQMIKKQEHSPVD